MPRIVPFSTGNAGMTRLRSKGNASPSTLYDLLNGYITHSGTIKPRPGTLVDYTLPADTKGLTAHKCKLWVFSHAEQVISDPDYACAVLIHPTDPTSKLAQIHFAAPFMGFLYVAAEFDDGNLWHYWLEELDAWSPDTDYMIGDRVFPTAGSVGYAYMATRPGSPNPAWAPRVARTIGDVIEPTVYNGFKYTVVATSGPNPASGTTEPDWPTEAGAQIIEYTAGSDTGSSITTPVIDPDPNLGYVPSRYDNPAGGFPGVPGYNIYPYNIP